VILVLI